MLQVLHPFRSLFSGNSPLFSLALHWHTVFCPALSKLHSSLLRTYLHLSRFSSIAPYFHHRLSSANIIVHRDSFLTSSVSLSITIAIKKALRACLMQFYFRLDLPSRITVLQLFSTSWATLGSSLAAWDLLIHYRSSCLSSPSNAFSGSTKVQCSSLWPSLYNLKANTAPLGMKPYCCFHIFTSALSLDFSSLSRNFIVWLSFIPAKLSQVCSSRSLLKLSTSTLLHSSAILSFFKMCSNNLS